MLSVIILMSLFGNQQIVSVAMGQIGNSGGQKFSLCISGVTWFQGKNKWQSGGTTPSAGMIIFFEWNHDGTSDHVGIVEKCEGGRVYTIEGNSSDQVRQRNYAMDYASSWDMG